MKKIIFTIVFLSFIVLFGWFPLPSFASFEKNPANPVLNIGATGTWDGRDVSTPMLIKDINDYKIWYYGTVSDLNGSIGLATSNNGTNWAKNLSNPVFVKDLTDPTEFEVASPSILKIGSNYKMWYLSTKAFTGSGNEVFRIKYATSPDGINWAPQGFAFRRSGASWEAEGVANPSVLYLNNQFNLWYDARDSLGIWRIGQASSIDGINWTRQPNPVLQASLAWEGNSVAAPSVIYYDEKYHLYYHAGPGVPHYIGHATSTDGINWTKDTAPILSRGGFASFDSNYIASPDAIRDGNKLKLYYAGHDGAHWRIGLAEEVLPVPYFSQADPLWGSDEYDNATSWANPGSTTMSSLGCAVTSAAMILKHFNVQKTPGDPDTGLAIKDLNPGTLNEWLKSKNDAFFRNGATNWALISSMTKQANSLDSTSPKLEYFASPSASLNQTLANNLPAILNLDYPPSPSNAHFVVATKQNGINYDINDPLDSGRTTFSPFYTTINRIGFYQPTNSDFSYLIFAVDENASLDLLDANGNSVGDEFIQKPIVDGISESDSGGEALNLLFLKQPNQGNYTLEVSSSNNQTYQLDAYVYDQQGEGGLENLDGIVGSNDSDVLNITIDPTSSENSQIVDEVTFNSLKDDIQTSYTLGWITNKGVYNSLLKKAENAEKAQNKGDSDGAIDLLNSLLSELTAQRGKYITEDAYTLLQSNIQSLLNSL